MFKGTAREDLLDWRVDWKVDWNCSESNRELFKSAGGAIRLSHHNKTTKKPTVMIKYLRTYENDVIM